MSTPQPEKDPSSRPSWRCPSLGASPPAAFVFTRSAATVSLSVFSPLSTSILSEPLAGAFNRQWHLSPRAVMSPIHQWGMTACMPHYHRSPTHSGGEGSHSTRPERFQGVCLYRCVCVCYKLALMVTGCGLLIIAALRLSLHVPRGWRWGRSRREDNLSCPSEGCFISQLFAVH